MRQLNIYVDAGQGKTVTEIAREHHAVGINTWSAESEGIKKDVISIHINNRSLGSLLGDLEDLPGLKVSFFPHEVITFTPPPDNTPKHVVNLEARSPIEIFLHSLQSVDQWGTFSTLAVAGAIVVWIAFYTNSIFLLLSAMLIAPFAEPAMNVAVSTALGDKTVFIKNLLRYLAAIVITALVSAVLAFFLQEGSMTELMVQISRVNSIAFLLPLVAGTAGALNVAQSERSSLVSGSAAGVLIAASLAPPAGLLGIALSLGNWNTAISSLFLLVLQLAGINLAGSLVLRIYGLTPGLARYEPGKKWIFTVSIIGTLVIMAGLLTWQYTTPLRFQRSSLETQMDQIVRQVINESGLAEVVEMNVRFPEPEPSGSTVLLITGYVRRASEISGPDGPILLTLKQKMTTRIHETNPIIDAMIQLNMVEMLPEETMDQ